MFDKVHSDPEDDPSVQETVMMGQKGANSAKTNTTTTSKCSKRDLCHQDWNQRHEQCIIANNNHFYNKLLKNKFILDSDILISFFPSKFLPEHLPKTKGSKFGQCLGQKDVWLHSDLGPSPESSEVTPNSFYRVKYYQFHNS